MARTDDFEGFGLSELGSKHGGVQAVVRAAVLRGQIRLVLQRRRDLRWLSRLQQAKEVNTSRQLLHTAHLVSRQHTDRRVRSTTVDNPVGPSHGNTAGSPARTLDIPRSLTWPP